MEKLKYIFIHGTAGWGSYDERYQKLPYWGMRGGDLIAFLNESGFESYAASVSPYGSAWDRACELYAEIYGMRTDYGRSHSERFDHERFGRDFSSCPLIPDFDDDTRLVLIGHSFGGTTARMFSELMAHGSPDEQKEADCSPLFLGGRESLIHSVVCIATAMNGNSVFDLLEDPSFDKDAVKVPWWSKLLGKRMANQLSGNNSAVNPNDCGDYDMRIDTAAEMNQQLLPLPGVYYLSVPCCCTKQKGNVFVPDKGMEPFFVERSFQQGCYTGITKAGHVIDESWLKNDGRVNTISETAPFGQLKKELDPNHLEQGMWNVHPEFHGDHMYLQGGLLHRRMIRPFYLNLLAMLSHVPS